MPKEDKLYANLFKTVEQFVQGKGYSPSTKAEIQQRLKLPKQHGGLLSTLLKELVAKKVLTMKKARYHATESMVYTLAGTIKVHPRGFGFVVLESNQEIEEDVFIPKFAMLGAVDGDQVEIEIVPSAFSDKGPEGKVVKITQRGRKKLAGIVEDVLKNKNAIVYVPILGKDKSVVLKKGKEALKIGDRVIMEVDDWGDDEVFCTFSSHLGHISDPSCDIAAAIEEFDLDAKFPSQAVKEAKEHGTMVSVKEIKQRTDLRELECFTIDPDTAKDFDDALTLTQDKRGHYHLGIHIADVSHYVPVDSALDKEAKHRSNSTYFPGFCLPMLPHELSDNLCSLKEKVNRLTLSVLVELDANGHVIHYKMVRSVIRSQKRFTYKEAKLVLDGKKKSKHAPTLHLMKQLCLLLKKRRFERGSVEFSMPELVLKVDKDGVPYTTETVEYDITHQMVEEFMLKANELVALHISGQSKPLTYRIHDVPSEENMRDFALLADAFGFKLPSKPTPEDLQKLFIEAEGSPHHTHLATHYIRRMKLAIYSPENIGHYGLALTHYCHFTSPIRRYVDLIAHRILFGEAYNLQELELISEHASMRERLSAKAEMSVLTLKKLRYAQAKKQTDPNKSYQAMITRIKPFGITFEVLELMLEGFIHISEVGRDYYVYEPATQSLYGESYHESFVMGQSIQVQLEEVDLIHQEALWAVTRSKKRK